MGQGRSRARDHGHLDDSGLLSDGGVGLRFRGEDRPLPVDHRNLPEIRSHEPEPVKDPAPAVPYPDFAGQIRGQGEFREDLEILPEKILRKIVLARRVAAGLHPEREHIVAPVYESIERDIGIRVGHPPVSLPFREFFCPAKGDGRPASFHEFIFSGNCGIIPAQIFLS